MRVEQISTIVNNLILETTGSTAVNTESLASLVSEGYTTFSNAQTAGNVDNFVKTLMNQIGQFIFVDRPYSGSYASLQRRDWEYASVLAKVWTDLPTAEDNPSWNLVDGQSYDPHVFKQPIVRQKFYNSMDTYQIHRSIADKQVKESFKSESQLNGFLSMLLTATENAITGRTEALGQRVVNALALEAVKATFGSATDYTIVGGPKAVNLLKLYNDGPNTGTDITAEQALTTPEFIRFAALQMSVYSDRLTKMSKLFNPAENIRFTTKDKQHTILLSDFDKAAGIYLYGDTFHDAYVKLPNAETVPYWQGSGVDYRFSEVSRIKARPVSSGAAGTEINFSGVLGIIFDRDAGMVCNERENITTEYNPVGEFTNYWYKMRGSYYIDPNENCIVFYVA